MVPLTNRPPFVESPRQTLEAWRRLAHSLHADRAPLASAFKAFVMSDRIGDSGAFEVGQPIPP